VNNLVIQLIGGPTAVLEYAGLRWLTDPAFSPPGEYTGLVKTSGPALHPEEIEPIDVVLLSHDQHSDNLDPEGRAFLPRAGRVLTTPGGAQRLGGNAVGLEPWSSIIIGSSEHPSVTVTAVPARHGPEGAERVTGVVIGFLLSAPGLETVYLSGDNASLDLVRAIAEHAGEIDVAVLHAGAVQRPAEIGCAYLTLSSDHAADATKILGARVAIPIHFEGWSHFTQGADALRAAFLGNSIHERLVLLRPGERVVL